MSEVSELALTIARWDNTFDGPETNRIPPWAINLAQAIIDSEWLAKRDLKPQDSSKVNPPVHNHGTEEGAGLACNERIVNGFRRGACLPDLELKDSRKEPAK